MIELTLAQRRGRFLLAAQEIAGPGVGWPKRLVDLAANAVSRDLPGAVTVSVGHLHNLLAGRREVTLELERLIVALAPEASSSLRRRAEDIEMLAAHIARDLRPPSPLPEIDQIPEDYDMDEVVAQLGGLK